MFLISAKNELPKNLYEAIKNILSARVDKALNAKESLYSFFRTYADSRNLNDVSITSIIYNFGEKKYPDLVEFASTVSKKYKENIVKFLTDEFFQAVGERFREEYYKPLVNLPWIIDSLNTFMPPRNAKRGIFYAGDSHIQQIVEFFKELQRVVGEDQIDFVKTYTNEDGLSIKQLADVLDIKRELEKVKLKTELKKLKSERELEEFERELEVLKQRKRRDLNQKK